MRPRNIVICGILFILLLLLTFAGCVNKIKGELETANMTIGAINGAIVKTTNKFGQEVSKKELILSNYKALKKQHVADSSELGQLKKLINKTTMSATIVKTTTSGSVKGKTNVIFSPDTNRRVAGELPDNRLLNPCDTVYPTYTDTIKDKWIQATIVANRDSTSLKYSVFNEFHYTQDWQKVGKFWNRRNVPTVTATNINPHTQTTAISSYAVQTPNVNKIARNWAIAGTILGVIGGIILTR